MMPTTAPEQPRPMPRPRSLQRRNRRDRLFVAFCIAAAAFSVLTLAMLLTSIILRGLPSLDWQFLSGVPSRDASAAGIWPATAGTFAICIVCAITAIPIGVGTAILLEEFRPRHPLLLRLHSFVQLNITNLAGVPSIVYGLLGLTAFATMFGLFGTTQDPAVQIGIRYYNQYLTPGGQVVLAPVSSPADVDKPPTAMTEFFDDQHRPIAIKVIDAAELAPQQKALDEALDRFADTIRDAMAGAPPAGDQAMRALIRTTWQQAGPLSEVARVEDELTTELMRAQSLRGREARRVIRNALRTVERQEATRRFPGILSSDAGASVITVERPWYIRLPFGRSVLAGGLTLMLVVLPIIIISAQEALRAVPRSLRQASLAMGATPWQTIWNVTLPSAVPGIMTGVILAMSRAIGEAAPILIIAGIVYITFTPQNLMDDFTAMPLQVYNWASRPQKEFYDLAAAGIILLLIVLLLFNGLAVYLRHKTQRQR